MSDALKGFIRAVIILSILFLVFYVFSYKIWEKKEFDSDVIYNEEDINKNDKPIINDVNIEEVGKSLYGKFNFEFLENNFGSSYFNEYYKLDGNYSKDFSSDFIVYTAVVNLLKNSFSNTCNTTNIITLSMLNDTVYELFGFFITNDSKEIVLDGLKITYDSNNKIYLVENNKCSGNLDKYSGYIKTELYKVEKNLDNTYVYETVYFYNVDKETGVENYYSGLNNKSKILAHKNIDLDRTKLSRYILIFDSNNKLIKIQKDF